MTNENFYIQLIEGTEPLSYYRILWVRNIIRLLSGNSKYNRDDGEYKKYDDIYDELINIRVRTHKDQRIVSNRLKEVTT